MGDNQDIPAPDRLPAEKLCNIDEPNPITGDGPLGNELEGKMYYKGSDKEELVKTLQQMLVTLGFNLGLKGVNGKFGYLTERTIKSFQTDNTDWEGRPLKVDGMAGPRTSDALNRKMVGIWYDHYETPKELTKGRLYFTATADALGKGLPIKPEGTMKARVTVVKKYLKIVIGDLNVLTKKKLLASDDFNDLDTLVIKPDKGKKIKLKQELGKVFVSPGVIVVGQDASEKLPRGYASLWVEGESGDRKTEEIACKIIKTRPRLSTVIPMSDKKPGYYICIVANPGIEDVKSKAKYQKDPILNDRRTFNRKVISILESLFSLDTALKDPDIRPYIRVCTLFDDELPPDKNNSLLSIEYVSKRLYYSKTGKTGYIIPRVMERSIYLEFLKKYNEKADVMAIVTGSHLTPKAIHAIDSKTGTDFTYKVPGEKVARKYVHGADVEHPGIFSKTCEPERYDQSLAVTLHEFLHAMSDSYNGNITDLYDDYIQSNVFYVNKQALYDNNGQTMSHNAGQLIPRIFAEYNGTTYYSDRPDPPYTGRGFIGYPGPIDIEVDETYGPELIDIDYPNIMDYYQPNPTKHMLDKLTHRFVIDKIKTKIDNRSK
jgi:hypothetical protein